MPISRIETNSIAPSQTLTTPIIATTMGVGGATPAGSGSGITFPAAQSASSDVNTLDDYEEGTWTPSIYGAATAGTQSASIKTGTYTKIGRFVYLRIYLSAFTLSGASGNIGLSGLPFTMTDLGGVAIYMEGMTPAYSGSVDSKSTMTVRGNTSTTTASFRPSVTNSWDSYMTASTTWTGGGGSTYGEISLWGTTT